MAIASAVASEEAAKRLFEEAIAECENSQNNLTFDSQSQTQTQTQTQELTQLAGDDNSSLLSHAATVPLPMAANPRTIPWGRLIAESKDMGSMDMTPRDPESNPAIPNKQGISFLGLENLHRSDVFNVYTMGRHVTCDVSIPKNPQNSTNSDKRFLDWAHSMISNRHCKVFSMLKQNGSETDMEVYIQDTSGNGTLINGTTLLRRGEKRILHTGDQICLVNPAPLRKKIRSADLLSSIQRKYTFIFVNLHQQQHHINKPKMMSPPASKRKGIVNPHGMMHHSMERHAADSKTSRKPIFPPLAAHSSKQNGPARRVEQFYDIRDVLGSGTCGEVRRAICRRTGEVVAIKVIDLGGRNRSAKLSPEHTAALKAEAQILQSLDHPYIIRLRDVFIHPGVAIYLVMELMEGGDLFDRIVKKGKYSENEARRTMRRLLNAIYYLHVCKNIVHRDLKPENILCLNKSSDIDVKLTDFGLAKTISDDGLRSFVGTPQYFAPEVLRRRYTVAGKGRYGREADMWSLGVIMYILLSGTPPFDVSESFDVVVNAKIRFPRKFWSTISDEAKNLVIQLLEQDPSKRISVEAACQHKWFSVEDSDVYRNPLDDPEAPMNRAPPSLPLPEPERPIEREEGISKRLFHEKDQSEKQSSEALKAQQPITSAQCQTPKDEVSPVDAKSSSRDNNNNNNNDDDDEAKASVVVSIEKNEPGTPTSKETDEQYYRFRYMIQKSTEKQRLETSSVEQGLSNPVDSNAVTPSARGGSAAASSNHHHHNNTNDVKRNSTRKQNQKQTKKQIKSVGKISPAELSEDAICSDFSDEDDVSSTSAERIASGIATNGTIRTKPSKDSKRRKIAVSSRGSSAKKRKHKPSDQQHKENVISTNGAHPVATGSDHEKGKAKRQTKLSNWFQKKEQTPN